MTLTKSVLVAAVARLVCVASPPPKTEAVLLTLTGELEGILTIREISGKLPPAPATTAVDVQVTILVPLQLQPMPVEEDNVYPLGSESATVTVDPSVAVEADAALFVTWSVQVPVLPWLNVPTCALVMARFAVVTVCGSPDEVLPIKLLSPAYAAVRVRAPPVVSEILQVPATTVPVQLSLPSLTVTLPVGVPAPGATGATAKFTATACPTPEGSGLSDVIVVVVSALLTVCDVAREEALPLKLLSPV